MTARSRFSFPDSPRPGRVALLARRSAALVAIVGAACGAFGVPVSSGAAAPRASAKWVATAMPQPSWVDVNLTGVACGSATDCVAVGNQPNATGQMVAAAMVWNGTSWSLKAPAVPSGSKGTQLNAVACPASGNCIAVGEYTKKGGVQYSLAERWNGTAWSILTTPNIANILTNDLVAVACSSTTSCEAVGFTAHIDGGLESTRALRWNGSTWMAQSTPAPKGDVWLSFAGVSCGPSTCEAVGEYAKQDMVFHSLAEGWSGTSWSVQSAPEPTGDTGSQFNAVACVSTNCSAVGSYTTADGSSHPLAEAWSGTAWSLQVAPDPGTGGGGLNGVSCTSATTCVAVGVSLDASGDASTLAISLAAGAWVQQTSGNVSGGDNYLLAVACTDATCQSVGNSRLSIGFDPLVEEQVGSTWQIEPTATTMSPQNSSLNAVSCYSATLCTAVGVTRSAFGPPWTLAERWNGTSWTVQTTINPDAPTLNSAFLGVACPTATTCIAVGYSFGRSGLAILAEYWSAGAWSVTTVPLPAGAVSGGFSGVSCDSSTSCVAAGNYATTSGVNEPLAELWNGSAWSILSTPTPAGSTTSQFLGVSCVAGPACMAVGQYNNAAGVTLTLAERWNGTSWVIESTPNGANVPSSALYGVSCSSMTFCAAVGQASSSVSAGADVKETWNGSSWTMEPVTQHAAGEIGVSMSGVACTSTKSCVAVGTGIRPWNYSWTLAEQWGGSKWAQLHSANPGYSPSLSAVACPTTKVCVAVGTEDNTGAAIPFAEKRVS